MATNEIPTVGQEGATGGEAHQVFVLEAGDGGDVTLPDGFNFGTAEFHASGPDLVLTAPNGAEVVIHDYFDGDAPPNIVTPEGGHLPGSTAARLAGPLAPGQFAQAAPTTAAEPIGQVENVTGTVTAVRADGTRVDLDVGDPVFQGDVLESSEDGGVGIVLADETTFSMAENGRMVLDEMVYDPGTQEGSISFSVLGGVFTFVSGQVAKVDPDAMVLNTPAATIGIRGTQVGLDLSGDEPMKVVLMEEADGFVGEVVISNGAGLQILNLPNQGAFIAGIDSAPSQPVIFNVSEVGHSFSGALGVLPTNIGTGNNYGVSVGQQGQNQTQDDLGEEQAAEAADSETEFGQEGEEVADFDTASNDSPSDFETAAGGDVPTSGNSQAPGFIQSTSGNPGLRNVESIGTGKGEFQVGGANNVGTQGGTGETNVNFQTVASAQALSDDELIVGTAGADTLDGGKGDDTIRALAGDDSVAGGVGDDSIDAGAGNDTVDGGAGDDTIDGGAGDDVIQGGAGDDVIDAGTGDDTVDGGAGGDTIDAGAGDDSVLGGAGDDSIDGGAGNDTLDGGAGDDTIDAGAGDDSVSGSAGDDSIDGGAGNDTLDGGAGDDTIDAGAGDDSVSGGAGDDSIDGGAGDDTVDGGAGDDTLFGSDGDDVLEGGAGVDEIVGGAGDDTIIGDANNDILSGGNGDDVIQGSSGDDTLVGGAGNDILDGGPGTDTANFSGNQDEYTFDTVDGGITVTDTVADRDGVDTLYDVENVEFADGTVTTDSIVSSLEGDGSGTPGDNGQGQGPGDNPGQGGGNDTLEGGAGNDTLGGGGGNDTLGGGGGNDTLGGGGGNDTLQGGSGDDNAGHGNDDDGNDEDNPGQGQGNGPDDNPGQGGGENTAPLADVFTDTIDEDGGLNGFLQATDVDGDNLTFTLADEGGPVHGSVSVQPNGHFIYSPEDDFFGTDTFTFQVSDGEGGTATQSATITVNPVNDIPVIGEVADGTVDEDGALSGTLEATDIDGDELTFSLTDEGGPAHGTIEIAADGSYSYTPDANFFGADSFTFVVSDGEGGTVEQTVAIDVNPLNDNPVVDAVTDTVDEDGSLHGALEATDVDGDHLTFSLADDGGAAHGDVAVHPNGNFTYTSNDNFFGTDSFTFQVSDGEGGVVTQSATITVNPLNDLPVIGEIADGTVDEDGALNGTLEATDVDGDELTFSLADDGGPAHGTIEIGADGSYSYSPDANFFGKDSFTFTVFDGQGGEVEQTVAIDVNPLNDNPLVEAVAETIDEDGSLRGALEATDLDGDHLTFSLADDGGPAHGAVAVHPNGNYTYTPDPDFFGTDTFTFQVSDGEGGTVTQTATVNVTPVNDAPEIEANETLVLDAGSVETLTGSLLNTTDVDDGADDLTYTLQSAPANGTLFLNGQPLHAGESFTQADVNAGNVAYGASDATDFQQEWQEGTPDWSGVSERQGMTPDPVDGENLQLPENGTQVTVTFQGEGAGYHNTVGWYKVDADGNPSDPQILWGDASQAGSGGDLIPGQSTATLEGLQAGEHFEFFVVRDGANQFDWIENIPEDHSVQFTEDGGLQEVDAQGQPVVDVSGALWWRDEDPHEVGADQIFHAANSALNLDGMVHATSGIGPNGDLVIGFEDLWGGGDSDFNDLMFSVNVQGEPNIPTSDSFVFDVTDASGASAGLATLAVDIQDPSVADVVDNVEQGVDNVIDQIIQIGEDAIQGTDDGDYLRGGHGDDQIVGHAGDDRIVGRDGDDTLIGSDGDDTLRGDDGNDVLSGGNGADNIRAGDGQDSVIAGAGDDTVRGDDGNDTLLGNDGDDVIQGGDGDDLIQGGAGDDVIQGDGGRHAGGDDHIFGGDGFDAIYGGDGVDYLRGDGGGDVIRGDRGDDIIIGGAGDDTLQGGSGDDEFIFNLGDGEDWVLDFGAGDKLTFEGATMDNVHFDVSDNGRDLVVTVIGEDDSAANKVTIKNGARDVDVDDDGNVNVGSGYTVTETHHDGGSAVVIDTSHHGVPG